MKYLKIFLIFIAVYSISIPAEMIFMPEIFKSAVITYLLALPFYVALITYYFHWRSNQPAEPSEEIA